MSTIICLFFFCETGQGTAKLLTLTEAIDLALTKNPTLQAADHSVEAAQAKVGQARSGLLPRLNFYEGYSRTNNPMLAVGSKLNQERFSAQDYGLDRLNDPPPVSNFNTQVVLAQPIFDQGKTLVGIKQAQLGKEAAVTVRERVKQEVVYSVIQAYAEVVLAGEDVNLAQETKEVAEAHVALAEDLYRAGKAVKSDVLSAKVRRSEVDEMLIQAENGLSTARAALNSAIGIDQSDEITVEKDLPYEKSTIALNAAIIEALERRPDLIAMEHAVKSEWEQVRMAKTDFLPSLSFVAQYDLNDERDIWGARGESWTIGGMLHFNVFDGLNATYKVREAVGRAKQRSLEEEALRDRIELEVREAFYQLTEAEGRVTIGREAILHAEESLRIVEDRYGVGLSRMVELLDSEVALMKARRNLLRAVYDCRVAQVKLDLARGVLSEHK